MINKIKYITVLTCLVLFHLYEAGVLAQDESKMARPKDLDYSLKVQGLIDSANAVMESQPELSFNFIEKALELSMESNDRRGEALSNHSLGKINYKLQQFDLAANYLQRALRHNYILNEEEINRIYFDLAQTYEKLNYYNLSTEYYQKYLEYAESVNDQTEIVNTKYSLARVHSNSGDTDKALQEYKDIQQIESKRDNADGYLFANEMVGEVYLQQNQPQAAIANYQQSVEVADEIPNKKAKSRSLRKLGDAYRQNKQFKEELDVRQQALEISEKEEGPEEQAEDNLAIGEIFIEQKNPDEAFKYIQKSVELSKKSGNIEKEGKALKTLSEAYKEKGDYEEALIAYKDYTSVIDEVYAKREQELRDNLELIASVNRKLQRIDMLEKDFEINRKTLEVLEREQTVNSKELRTQKRITFALIVVLFLISLASVFVYRSSVQKRKANQLLALRSLRSQMNPHFIFNSLNSVNNFIAQNNERLANKYLSDFSKLMRAVMENSKHDFVPVNSEIEIIDLYIKLEHSRFQDKFDYEFLVDRDNIGSDITIPPMLIQPYIENAVWHGLRYKEEKGKLTVELLKQNGHILAKISDDGIGRKKSLEMKTKHQKQNSSTGIKNITNRLDIINDIYKTKYTVTIEDLNKEKHSGTLVQIKIPYELEV